MSEKWYEVDQVVVANGAAHRGDLVAVAVGDGRYGGGLRLGRVELLEAHDYTARGLREWAAPDDFRPVLTYGNGEEIWNKDRTEKLVSKPDETRQNYRIRVRVTNDCGSSKNYAKVYEYPQRIAVMQPWVVATEI